MLENKDSVPAGKSSEANFNKLLAFLDRDPEIAGEKYLELCLKLRKFFAWKGCAEARLDILTDETLDRVANNLASGVDIENLNSYVRGVARHVWLEQLRKPPEEPLEEDALHPATTDSSEESDDRYECLEQCLSTLAPEDREQILGYYNVDENQKTKDARKTLAARFGKTSGALKVHATRLREKLEKCITSCLQSKNVTKVTN